MNVYLIPMNAINLMARLVLHLEHCFGHTLVDSSDLAHDYQHANLAKCKALMGQISQEISQVNLFALNSKMFSVEALMSSIQTGTMLLALCLLLDFSSLMGVLLSSVMNRHPMSHQKSEVTTKWMHSSYNYAIISSLELPHIFPVLIS